MVSILLQRNIIAGLILTLPFSRFLNFDVVANLAISDFFLLLNFILAMLSLKISIWSIPIFILFLANTISYLFNYENSNVIVLFSFLLKAFLCVQIINTKEYFTFYLKVLILSGIFWILMGILLTDGLFFDLTDQVSQNRNELAHYSLLVYFFSCLICFSKDIETSKEYKLLSLFMIMMSSVVILVSQSRGAIIAWGLVQIVFLIKNRKFFLLFLLGIFTTLVFSVMDFSDYELQRITTITSFEPATNADEVRIENLILGYELFSSSPVTGIGPGGFILNHPENKVMHNTYASTIVELGILGFVSLLLLFIFPLILFLRKKVHKFSPLEEYCLFGAMFAISIHSMTIESLSKFAVFLSFSILISSILMKKNAR